MDSQALALEFANAEITTIRVDRPEPRNTLTEEIPATLREALERVASDDGAPATVPTGDGGAFCAGADV